MTNDMNVLCNLAAFRFGCPMVTVDTRPVNHFPPAKWAWSERLGRRVFAGQRTYAQAFPNAWKSCMLFSTS